MWSVQRLSRFLARGGRPPPRAGPARRPGPNATRARAARDPRRTRTGRPPPARGARRVCARAVPARGDVFARALHNSRMRNPLYTSAQCPPPAPSESGAPDGEEQRSRPRPANDIGPPHRPGPAEASVMTCSWRWGRAAPHPGSNRRNQLSIEIYFNIFYK